MIFRSLQRSAMVFALALALTAAFAAANGVQAFTFMDQEAGTNRSGNSASGGSNLVDPDPNDRLTSRFNSGQQTVIKRGNATIFFGGQPQSFDQRNNPDDYFRSDRLMGR